MLALIPSWLKFAAIGLAAAALVAWLAYTLGTGHGRQQAAVDALERSVTILRDRKLTDDQIDRMSDDDLCRALGGRVLDNGACE